MDEKKETNEEKHEENHEDKTDAAPAEETGNKEKTTSVLDRADEINDRKERILKREEELQNRKEEFAARKSVGGETEAGGEVKKETEDEKWAKGAKERYEGTGMDPTPDDSPTEFK